MFVILNVASPCRRSHLYFQGVHIHHESAAHELVAAHQHLSRLLVDNYTGQFDSPYNGFYVSTAVQLVLTNLHEDLWLEYKSELDDFLTQLHNRSKSHNLRFLLPRVGNTRLKKPPRHGLGGFFA